MALVLFTIGGAVINALMHFSGNNLNGIKVRVFFGKNKSNIPVINLIASSRNIIKVSKIMSL